MFKLPKGNDWRMQGSQRQTTSTLTGAGSLLGGVHTSLHILFHTGISSSDNSDFLQFREDSEPWITLDLWRLVGNYHKAQQNVLQFIRNFKKKFYLADVLKYQNLHTNQFQSFSYVIFPILECQQRYSWKMIWQQLWNMTNSARTSKKLLNSQMNDQLKQISRKLNVGCHLHYHEK